MKYSSLHDWTLFVVEKYNEKSVKCIVNVLSVIRLIKFALVKNSTTLHGRVKNVPTTSRKWKSKKSFVKLRVRTTKNASKLNVRRY